MKIKVTKSALVNGLQIVHDVVPNRTPLPILGNALVVAEKDKVYLTTTDLELTVRCAIEAEVQKTGATTLPMRRLLGIVRELPEESVDIEVDDINTATITCASSFFKIIGISEQDFPPVAKMEGKSCYRIDQGVFKNMLKKTSYAASKDETRYVLNGVLLSFKAGKLAMVATDGRRLALIEYQMDFPTESELDVILPNKAVSELEKILGDEGELRIFMKDKQMAFEFNHVFMAAKLVDGTYPNYRQVIPSQCEHRISIEREGMLTALRRVSVVTSDKSNATKLSFAKNKLTITMNTPDVGEARESLPVKFTGENVSVAFNAEYLMDPLRTLTDDEVAMELVDDLSPGVIKCNMPFLYVLMPIKVN